MQEFLFVCGSDVFLVGLILGACGLLVLRCLGVLYLVCLSRFVG